MPHIRDAWTVSNQAARHYNCSAITRFIKLFYLRINYGYGISHAKFWGLLKPGARVTTKTRWGYKRTLKYSYELNPPEHIGETDDKIRFAKTCLRENLPAPSICGIFNPGGGFHRLNENTQSNLSWEQFVSAHICDDFVVKPQFGFGGHLVYLFHKEHDSIESTDFGSMTADEFLEQLKELYTDCPALIQEKAYNHSSLTALLSVDILTTVRITLIRDQEGTERIIFAFIKFPGIEKEIDNFGLGERGGVLAEMNIETGTIEIPTEGLPDGFGINIITHHPVSGMRLKGAQIPLWKETCELAIKASKSIKNMRSVGWDIAITPNGPSIIEGNSAWGYPNTNDAVHQIQTELVKACGQL
jgi:hypothetical protein